MTRFLLETVAGLVRVVSGALAVVLLTMPLWSMVALVMLTDVSPMMAFFSIVGGALASLVLVSPALG